MLFRALSPHRQRTHNIYETDDVFRETDISTEELFNQADCFSSQLHVLMDAALSDDRCAYK